MPRSSLPARNAGLGCPVRVPGLPPRPAPRVQPSRTARPLPLPNVPLSPLTATVLDRAARLALRATGASGAFAVLLDPSGLPVATAAAGTLSPDELGGPLTALAGRVAAAGLPAWGGDAGVPEVAAWLAVPLVCGGDAPPDAPRRRVCGALCVVDQVARQWGDDVRLLADVAALAGEGAATGALRDAELALRHSDERYRLVARATTDLIYDWSVVDDTIQWSDAGHELFGYDLPSAQPTLAWWVAQIHPDDRPRVTESRDAALADTAAELWTAEYRLRRGDGGYAVVLDRGCVVRDAAGRAIRVIGAMSDVTQRRHLEERLRQSQKMEAMGRLAGGVAHDFNNVLTAVRSYSELLLDDLGADPALAPLAADVEEIRRAVDRAAALTRQLLAFSRKQVVRPRRLDVAQVLAGLEPMLRRLTPESITLEVVPPASGESAPVVADVGQLEQIVLNLCVNARDAMPQGGTLLVQTRPSVARDGREWVAIVVRDTGIGMDDATRARIFEPFFTTKALGLGTGLGLATVYGIVEQAHGLLDVESAVGEGTTFTVLLPREEPRDEAGLAEGAGETIRGGGGAALRTPSQPEPGARTVLVVEDEDAVRTSLRRILSRQGYRVLEARNGVEALRVVAGHLGTIDLLLTDVVMPEMGGRELAEWIVGARPEARVVFISGYTGEVRVRGGAAFVQKPFSAAEVVRVVGEVLAAP